MNRNLLILLIIFLAIGLIWFYFFADRNGAEIETESPLAEKPGLIKVFSPKPNEVISNPVTIEGEARGYWFFEASFPVRIFDDNGLELGVVPAQAQGEWMTEDFVPFKAVLEFSSPTTSAGVLVLEKDNPSGLPENADELRVPVRFDSSIVGLENINLKVFFNNPLLDPEISCNRVFPVEREVSKTQAVARAALTELLNGVTVQEEIDGFFTNINEGVKIQSLSIENGVARVDFDEQLEFQVGGSCRVAAIRAQITETLKQFSTVQEVVISINGRTEDILQP